MRTLMLIPVVLAAVAIVGIALCKLLGFNPHLPQMAIAIGICALGSIAGAVPLWFVRNSTQYAVSQAALLGTMAHMFACVAAAAMITLGGVAGGLRLSLVFWLMACFVATLTVIAAAYVKTLRAARIEPTPDVRQS